MDNKINNLRNKAKIKNNVINFLFCQTAVWADEVNEEGKEKKGTSKEHVEIRPDPELRRIWVVSKPTEKDKGKGSK